MYPSFFIYWVQIFTFWIILSLSFFLFLWMLKKTSSKFDINFSFFTNRILYFFLSTIVFSRIFYIIANWDEWKFINNFFDFFIMEDYNFSLFWAIFWFLLVLFFSIKRAKLDYKKYLDVVVVSFFFILVFWYLWALFWWQIIGKPTDFWIELYYNNSFAVTESSDVPVFPLAIIYSVISFIIFSVLYSLLLFVKTRGFIWLIWLMLLWAMIISLDSFNNNVDFFKWKFWISFSQILSIITIIISAYFLWKLKPERKTNLKEK